MAVRRAGGLIDGSCTRTPVEVALASLLRKAGDQEIAFIRLTKAGVQEGVIDLAYAVLGEEREGGPASGQVTENGSR